MISLDFRNSLHKRACQKDCQLREISMNVLHNQRFYPYKLSSGHLFLRLKVLFFVKCHFFTSRSNSQIIEFRPFQDVIINPPYLILTGSNIFVMDGFFTILIGCCRRTILYNELMFGGCTPTMQGFPLMLICRV